ncbi:MAG: hypothetical protein K2G04_11155, partial [Oscillospiraceae bacterium]|nr:hypothetical protein [Oscillospiraceae bacterium]
MPLALGILAVNAAAFIFALRKNKFWLIAAAAAFYTIMDVRFLLFLAVNIVFDFIIRRIEKPLENIYGYPF